MENTDPPLRPDSVYMPDDPIREDRFAPPPEPENSSGWWRSFLAFLLVMVLIFGTGYAALRPIIMGQFSTSDYNLSLMSVFPPQNEACNPNAYEGSRFVIPATSILCICGQVRSNGQRADRFNLRLYSEPQNQPIAHITLKNTPVGNFCYRWELGQSLSNGQYRLDAERQFLLDAFRFRVQSSRSL